MAANQKQYQRQAQENSRDIFRHEHLLGAAAVNRALRGSIHAPILVGGQVQRLSQAEPGLHAAFNAACIKKYFEEDMSVAKKKWQASNSYCMSSPRSCLREIGNINC